MQIAEALLGERGQNGVTDPALGPVILDHDDATAGRAGRVDERIGIDGLHGVEIDDADRDVLVCEDVDRLQRFVQRDAGRDDRRAVFVRAAANDFAAAMGKLSPLS